MPHEADAPAPFLTAWCERLAGGPGPVLDLACGRGRHALALARAGATVVALDVSAEALAETSRRARAESLPGAIHPLRADLETGHGLPLAPACCSAVVVMRYLHRPLAPEIERVLAPGGWLLYETFTVAQRALPGGPRRAEFLLAPGELPQLFPGLVPVASEEGVFHQPGPQAIARLVARRLA